MPFSFLASLLLSILIVVSLKLNPLRPILQPLISPLTGVKQLLNEQQDFIYSLPKLMAENGKLKEENGHLKVTLKKLSESINNQETIKAAGTHAWQAVPVKIVSLDNLATFSGQDLSGVTAGQPVVSGEILVGIVKKVEPPIVTVLPLNSQDLNLDVQLEDGSHGKYMFKNGAPSITNLPNNIAFNPRTTVFTLPTNQIPENLIIGQVSEIITNQANPVQEVKIILDQPLVTAKNFQIITKPY